MGVAAAATVGAAGAPKLNAPVLAAPPNAAPPDPNENAAEGAGAGAKPNGRADGAVFATSG